MIESLVAELAERLDQAHPSSLLRNRWLQLGVAVAIGYAIGRSRSRVELGNFGRTLATAAATSLFRTAMAGGTSGKPPVPSAAN